MNIVPLFEPCANTSNGINILRDGKPVWSSCDEDANDVTNGVYSNQEKWNHALLLCSAMILLEMADRNGYAAGLKDARS